MRVQLLAPPNPRPGVGTEADALIQEARRRQRRRYLAAGVAAAVAVAGVATAVAVSGSGGGRTGVRGHAAPASPPRTARPAPGLRVPGAATTVVLWPIGYPAFTQTSGPPAYVDELASGHHWLRQIPGIIGCDCRPYVIGVGKWIVYPGSGGTTAVSPDLTGKPRLLGATTFFAPSARPGQVWLIRYLHGYGSAGPVLVWPVPVAEGPVGPAITMPRGTEFVIRGTAAGFLLQLRPYVLALWTPGSAPRPLPYAPADGVPSGFDASARLIAYGSGCKVRVTARKAGLNGYDLCPVLRVLDVVTGRLRSFSPPPGTAGWVPSGFNTTSEISPGNGLVAAYAERRPVDEGRTDLYVLRLGGQGGPAIPVPSSAGYLSNGTAWTARASWLLYRSRDGHMWAYQVTSGAVRPSRSPFSMVVSVSAAAPAG